jgi:glycosyltransferase involved in cell wall biosynthesis
MRVSFIVPVYNEETTLEAVLERLEQLSFDSDVIVVDDGSTDGTSEILQRWSSKHERVIPVRQAHQGKGAAVRAAIAYVRGDIVVIQDADMEYDPADVRALIEPIERGAADVVYGSRLTGGRPQRAYLFWHLVANRCLALVVNVLYNTTLSDIETGYKAFRADVLRSLDLRENGFGVEPEITAKILRRGLRVYQIPVAYYGRTYAEGKKIRWTDGVRALQILLCERLRRRERRQDP